MSDKVTCWLIAVGSNHAFSLNDLAETFGEEVAEGGEPKIKVLRSLGPQDNPHTLVAEMSEEDADKLKEEHGDNLIIERDESVWMDPPMPTP